MKKKTQLLGFSALCASAAMYACGDDTTTGGNPLDSGSTGLDASIADASGTDSASSDGQSGTDTGTDAGTDSGFDAGPWCGAIDGGALCSVGHFAQFPAPIDGGDAGAPTCAACPTAPLTCTTAVLTVVDGGLTFTPPTYSTTTHLLSFTLPPGQRQIISVTNATVVASGTCYGSPSAASTGPQSVTASVTGDTITFDLGGTDAGANAGPCGVITFTAEDACCTTSNVTLSAFWDAEINKMTNGSCPDGG